MKGCNVSLNERNMWSIVHWTAIGFDSIPINVMKETFPSACNPLTYICNLSIASGIVPI